MHSINFNVLVYFSYNNVQNKGVYYKVWPGKTKTELEQKKTFLSEMIKV